MKEILTPRNILAEDYDLNTMGISQSLLGIWNHCQRAFVLRVSGYEGYSKPENFIFGNLVHEVNDKSYTAGVLPGKKKIIQYIDEAVDKQWSDGVILTSQIMEKEAALTQAVMVPYFDFYKSDFTEKNFYDIEKRFDVKYSGARLRGKIDGKFRTKVRKSKWLMEHKTKGQINEDSLITYLPLDLQNRMYLLADWIESGELAKGVLYNVIRKPGNKQLKNESLKDFMEKITEACQSNPTHYYKRWEVPYTEKDIDNCGAELSRMLEDIKFKADISIYPSTSNCLKPFSCQYLRACSENSLQSLKPGRDLFPELAEETDNASKKSTIQKKSNTQEKKVLKRVLQRKVAKRVLKRRK